MTEVKLELEEKNVNVDQKDKQGKSRLSSEALQPMNENTPIEPKQKFRIAHNFEDKHGYIRRGKAGDLELSIAMFVKDEGETIYDVLHAVAGVAKEYVIGIDKKTSDNTREEIERFKQKYDKLEFNVYEFDWEDDFSKARNEAIDECSYPWILILDGHDVFDIECTITLIDAMGVLHDDVWIVEFFVYMNPDEDNIPMTFFPQPRLIRNRKECRYTSAVHNYIRIDSIHKVIVPDLIIFHKRTKQKSAIRSEQRKDMGIKFFRENIEENPNDQRALFYLGNMMLEDQNDFQSAVEYYTRYLSIGKKDMFLDERSQVYINLCAAYMALNKPEKVLTTVMKGLGEGIQRRELWMILGDYYKEQKRFKEAITYYFMATRLPMPLCQLFLSGPIYTYMPWERLAQCYTALENFAKARESFIKILDSKPRNKEIINNIRNCERKLKIKEKVKPNGINISVFDSFRSFIDPICDKLGAKHNVRLSKDFSPIMANMSDFMFIEWADRNAVLATEQDLNVPIVLRIHRYELFTEAFGHINFNRIHAIIFVAEHVKQLALKMYPDLLQDLEDQNRIHVIPNSIDPDLWPFLDKTDANKVLLLGGIRPIKNYQLALELAKINPDIEFHHVGKVSLNNEISPFLDLWMKDCKNFIMHGLVLHKELNKKIAEINPAFVINTSMIEGHPVGMLEMMAKGIIPIVYHYPGALESLKLTQEYQYKSVLHFKDVISYLKEIFSFNGSVSNKRDCRKTLRTHVRDNFSENVILPQIYNLCMAVYDEWDVMDRKKKNPLKPALEMVDMAEVDTNEDKSISI